MRVDWVAESLSGIYSIKLTNLINNNLHLQGLFNKTTMMHTSMKMKMPTVPLKITMVELGVWVLNLLFPKDDEVTTS